MTRAIFAFCTSAVIQILGMASGLLAARVLGPQLRGELAGLVSFVSAFAALGALGLADATVFRTSLSGSSETGRKIIVAALLASLCTATLSMAAAVVIMPHLLRVSSNSAIFLFIPNILLNHLSLVIVARAQASQSNWSWSLYRLLPTLSAIIITIIFLMTGIFGKLECFLLGLMSGNLAILLCNLKIIRHFRTPDTGIFDEVKSLLSFGVRLHPATVMGAVRENLDRILMGVLLSATALGYYAVAATLAAPLMMIGITIDMIAFPRLSEQTNPARKKMFLAYVIPALLLILLASSVVGLSSSVLIPTLFGRDFGPAAPLAPIFAVAYGAAAAKSVIGTSLKAAGRPGLIGTIELATTLLFAAALPVAVLTYGAAGAAASAAIIQSASLMIFVYFAAKDYELKTADLHTALRDSLSLVTLALTRAARGAPGGSAPRR